MAEIHVVIDFKGLKKFSKQIASDLRNKANGPIRKAIRQWAARYRTFLRDRFVKFSRGGGNWKPLKRKRKRGSLNSVAILRNTGTMFSAFQPVFQSKPGQLQQDITFGVRVGYGGPGRHKKGGTATIADIAAFHQVGVGFLPVRKIIVLPDSQVISKMSEDMKQGLIKLERATDGGKSS